MTVTRSPRVLTWLLERFLSGPERESVIGDLIEQHRRGRSSWWLWRQGIGSVIASVLCQSREHKVLALRAVVVGMVVLKLLSLAASPVTRWVGISFWNWTLEHDLDTLRVAFYQHSGFILLFLKPCLFWLIAGYVVARTHREREMAMVIAFVVFQQGIYLGQMIWYYVLSTSAALIRPSFNDFLAINVTLVVLANMFALTGGLLAVHPDDSESPKLVD